MAATVKLSPEPNLGSGKLTRRSDQIEVPVPAAEDSKVVFRRAGFFLEDA